MSKQLVTVAWSISIEIEVPEGDVPIVELSDETQARLISEAWSQIQKSDGEITDMEPAE